MCQISHSLSSFKPLTLLADSLHNYTSPVSATANRDHLSPLLLHTSPPCNLNGSFLLGKSFWSRAGDEMNITTLSPVSVGIAYYRATVAFLGQFFCNKWCSVWRFARITDHIFHWSLDCPLCFFNYPHWTSAHLIIGCELRQFPFKTRDCSLGSEYIRPVGSEDKAEGYINFIPVIGPAFRAQVMANFQSHQVGSLLHEACLLLDRRTIERVDNIIRRMSSAPHPSWFSRKTIVLLWFFKALLCYVLASL